MTQPAESTPGAPAAHTTTINWFRLDRHDAPEGAPGGEPGSQDPQAGREPAGGAGGQADPWANFQWDGNVDSLPEPVAKIIREARADAAKSRTNAKQTAADEARKEVAAQVAKALGITTGDEPPDPAKLTEQIEAAQAAAWRSGVELNVYRLAGELGARAEALLDSVSFVDSLDDLVEVDPRSAEFGEQLKAKVAAAIERNPSFKAATQGPTGPRPDPSQGRGANNGPTDFRKAPKAEVDAELAKYGIRPRSR